MSKQTERRIQTILQSKAFGRSVNPFESRSAYLFRSERALRQVTHEAPREGYSENPIKIEKHSRPAAAYWLRRRHHAKRLDAYVSERSARAAA